MKPFIATDTKQPLVIFKHYRIGGRGEIIPQKIPTEITKPTATKDDIKLLDKYGIEKLNEMKFYGVIDRLRNSELLNINK